MWNTITYWNDVVLVKGNGLLPDLRGEVFFEAVDGYYLREL